MGNSKLSMIIKDKINAFTSLGKFLLETDFEVLRESEAQNDIDIVNTLRKAEAENGWFTQENIKFSLKNWGAALSEENLNQWISKYDFAENQSASLEAEAKGAKTVAIIMAGNVPLVGFHDFLSVLITGNKALVKLSSNDKKLLPFLAEKLISIEPEFEKYIEFTEGRLTSFDAVIATGSNNTSRYFDYYFGKYPNIIRKNRNSVAVLTGNETEEDLKNLADDIFRYFGLGCRNVSKIYIPEDYDFELFFKGMFSWKEIIHNHKYINNYDYNKAVYLMDSFPLLDNEFMLLKEDAGFSSPISVVFYEKYTSKYAVKKKLEAESENIQCLITKAGLPNEISFGKAQNPELWNYPDNIDTVDFLLKLP